MDTVTSATFTKTGTGVATGADAYVFSDDLSTLQVGTSVSHTFDTADDFATSEGWKCRYVIAYATAANKASSSGITVNLYNYKATFEFIGASDTIFSSTTALFGYSSSSASRTIQYVNIENCNFYNNTISASSFCRYCYGLQTIKLPSSLTTISGTNFCYFCYSLPTILLPSVTTISSSYFCQNCYSLKYINLPAITSWTSTTADILNYTSFIELPTGFNQSACDFTGYAPGGYLKSIAWFSHLATVLYDRSATTAGTMVVGAANLAIIPSAIATAIANKNWTLS
jgi:hypothetical protein